MTTSVGKKVVPAPAEVPARITYIADAETAEAKLRRRSGLQNRIEEQ